MKWSPDMAIITMDGLNADNANRILGVSRPTMFPLMAGSRPRRTGPHQLAYAANRRESKHLAGGVGVRSVLSDFHS
jgi:hypothetical protein